MSAVDEALEEFGLRWDHDLVSEDNDRFEVSGLDDEKVRADSGELAINGLSKCLGIAVYDHTSGKGYAAHVVTAENSSDELADYLEDFNTLMMKDEVDYENSEIMVAGIDYDEEVSDKFLGDERERSIAASEGAKKGVAEKFAEKYFAESNIYWNIEDEKTASIVMDIDEGAFSYDPAFDDR